ncbi:MAG: type I-D CRISPR-associated helicase Cas3' [Synechococcaceae cyanobacterium SM2_3_1]|nr:type I-D CRISPR-associated helicase Cas3' [Synechococcaceae cyanobacterium SM2_3_1]
MTLIKLKSVYSAPALDTPEGVSLPSGWSLTWHQAETLQALRDPEVDVVINTAMTGDGKSLAAYLSVLQDDRSVLGLYPTNELARDQEGQVQRYLDLFGQRGQHPIQRLSGPDLELLAESGGVGKAVALETATTQADILLTNPDLFHYLHRGAYLTPWATPNSLWARVDQLFNLFVFDEFHVFSAPQIASTLNTLLLIRQTNRAKKFLFLSATPDPQLLNYLTQAGFRAQLIAPQEKEKYQFPEDTTAGTALQAQGWRPILQAVDLEVVGLESGPLAAEQWLREHVLQIRQYFLNDPGSKGAVILNSVAAVKRLLADFQILFAEVGLQVEENTGLTGRTTRLKSLQADLVLGTSTIDVGVDFQINLLIFESADAGSFIQRLGRLGRHASYQRDGEEITFTQFRGIALLPRFLQERLFLKDGSPLEDGGWYDRPALNVAVENSFQTINDFRGYYRRWAPLQSFQLWWDLGNPKLGEHYKESREQFGAACETTFGIHPRRMGGRIKAWAEAWKQLSDGQKGNPIFEEAVTFRGSSPLQCGLLDLTEAQATDRFKTYDLPGDPDEFGGGESLQGRISTGTAPDSRPDRAGDCPGGI